MIGYPTNEEKSAVHTHTHTQKKNIEIKFNGENCHTYLAARVDAWATYEHQYEVLFG
jgi:hypothetical protein